jgi:hypothetical protein
VIPQIARPSIARSIARTVLLLCLLHPLHSASAQTSASTQSFSRQPDQPILALKDSTGSTFIPLDSWIYPAVARLYSLGYVSSTFLGMRPWTRKTVLLMLQYSQEEILDPNVHSQANDQAQEIFERIYNELSSDVPQLQGENTLITPDSLYTRIMPIAGPVLNDSFHAGQTVVNDFGRPYQSGFNAIAGFSARAASGRFTLFVRGEYQHSPSAAGYSSAVAQNLQAIDETPNVPQPTIPEGPISAANQFHLLEANLSAHILNHEISFGKSDAWLGPAQGASMAWSDNAQNIYTFRIDRVEPLHIPWLSAIVGPAKYDFFVGSLKGHTDPNAPWIHSEKISFKPTENFEFGFQRSVIWGGADHVPVTIATFFRSFFSAAGVSPATKFSRQDPGARFSTFDFSYRVPGLRNWLTLYTDSTAHDNVFPISNPFRAGFRPGIYLARLPHLPKLDLRAEAAVTDVGDPESNKGRLLYWEAVQVQGYTNDGNLIGDWIGRESKGGQAWLTYHLSGNQWLQLTYRNAKADNDFISGGTTQNDLSAQTLLRFRRNLELNAMAQYEWFKAPLLANGLKQNLTATIQITWFPQLARNRPRP